MRHDSVEVAIIECPRIFKRQKQTCQLLSRSIGLTVITYTRVEVTLSKLIAIVRPYRSVSFSSVHDTLHCVAIPLLGINTVSYGIWLSVSAVNGLRILK